MRNLLRQNDLENLTQPASNEVDYLDTRENEDYLNKIKDKVSLRFDFNVPSKYDPLPIDKTQTLLPSYGDILASATSQF